MGQVSDAVKGSPLKSVPAPTGGNLRERVGALCDEVSSLVAVKDDDAEREGAAALPENRRKAALLRACFSLLRAVKTLLDDY
jgi:hypothetical protein